MTLEKIVLVFLLYGVFFAALFEASHGSALCGPRKEIVASEANVGNLIMKCRCIAGFFGTNCRYKAQDGAPNATIDAEWQPNGSAIIRWQLDPSITQYQIAFRRVFYSGNRMVYTKWRKVTNEATVNVTTETMIRLHSVNLPIRNDSSYEVRISRDLSQKGKQTAISAFLDSPDLPKAGRLSTLFEESGSKCFQNGAIVGGTGGVLGSLVLLVFVIAVIKNSTTIRRLCCGRNSRPTRNVSGLSSGEILIEIPQQSSSSAEVNSVRIDQVDLGPACILRFDEVHEVLMTPPQSPRSSPQLFEVSRCSSPEAPYVPWPHNSLDGLIQPSDTLCKQEAQCQPSEPSCQPIETPGQPEPTGFHPVDVGTMETTTTKEVTVEQESSQDTLGEEHSSDESSDPDFEPCRAIIVRIGDELPTGGPRTANE